MNYGCIHTHHDARRLECSIHDGISTRELSEDDSSTRWLGASLSSHPLAILRDYGIDVYLACEIVLISS